ncbi:ribosome small subunit-dependent GTPase A [Actinomadura rupiterrae]|uniref:ribosome small subunit-dependent GTPase A n=1 Tax=Actinomadura rupiterrae TaxID=559627 RepID=UPI0020A38C5E|nr:ribosome small subunit-dependent GTPase A [Actinomadura rupiterrae]MCP2342785.1 ribosome biogenesis GTPase [Actinomadura rupiterrae]
MTSGSSASLHAYGWDDALDTAFASHRDAGLVPGRIVAVDRGLADTATADGVLRADTRAVTASGQPPVTGDWAAVRPGDPASLAALLPRRTAIVRASASGDSRGQALAANVDTVAVVCPLGGGPDLARIERLLALAWDSGAVPVVVLTKADLVDDPEPARAEVAAAAPGAAVLTVSAADGTGLDAATAELTGTVVLLGPSGAGKSTLGNALLGEDRLATGAVRAGDGKGRHTTVRRELVPLPGGGVLIDTPGLRGIGLFDSGRGVEQAFADIEAFAEHCRFADCAHDSEPGCAVQEAIEDGALPRRRLDSYRKLLRENDWIAARTDARLRAERNDRWKAITRAQRQAYRLNGRKDR